MKQDFVSPAHRFRFDQKVCDRQATTELPTLRRPAPSEPFRRVPREARDEEPPALQAIENAPPGPGVHFASRAVHVRLSEIADVVNEEGDPEPRIPQGLLAGATPA